LVFRRARANAAFPKVNTGICEPTAPRRESGRDFHRFFRAMAAPPLFCSWFKKRILFAKRQFSETGRYFLKGPAPLPHTKSAAGFCFFAAEAGG